MNDISVTVLVIFGLFWTVVGFGIGFAWARERIVKHYRALLQNESDKVLTFSKAYSEQRDLQEKKDELLARSDAIVIARLQNMINQLDGVNNAKS